MSRSTGRVGMVLCALAACLCMPAAGEAARPTAPPKPILLNGGWQIRDSAAAAPAPQSAPPSESEEGQENGGEPAPVQSPGSRQEREWQSVRVPGVFDVDAAPSLFGGTVKEYRLRFRAPRTRAFKWAFHFEQSRRRTIVTLNGRSIGRSVDPYTPFELEAKGLRPGKVNELLVSVDSRKDPRLPEAWWNWGGITRPVTLVPRGRVNISNLGLLADVQCLGPAARCAAKVLTMGTLSKLAVQKRRVVRIRRGKRVFTRRLPVSQPTLNVRLRSPSGRVTRRTLKLSGSPNGRRRLNGEVPVPAPELWSPERPNLYRATVTLTHRGRIEQVRRMNIGLRSVEVKRGLLHLNNRRIQLRGASLHEDMSGHGAALTGGDFDTIVRELRELGANVTRSHYVLSEGLLRRLDRAGIMVWNQAPVWQRDHGANLLRFPIERKRAVAQVERTVRAARNHPSVITHSVANELAFKADTKLGTKLFLRRAQRRAQELDPTLPISVDTKGRPGFGEQFAYGRFEMIGINQYFGWYEWVKDFNLLEPFLQEMRDHYPNRALVMTEFGAEGRPDLAGKPADFKGSYAFQEQHVNRTLDVVDRQPWLSGAIHWTLREFEIFPGWLGGAYGGSGRNTRHHKGLLTYEGGRKPAWSAAREHYLRTPLYP
ncbi:MAG TPA: glycoside hydrolase family 2 TIM barrel-domain containing protein [Thermoleophilaceae bacterium]|nr:glycoside hydrolase family 2 TIM barrel-domain containing protein [Thermoleophilaceae bacterium]